MHCSHIKHSTKHQSTGFGWNPKFLYSDLLVSHCAGKRTNKWCSIHLLTPIHSNCFWKDQKSIYLFDLEIIPILSVGYIVQKYIFYLLRLEGFTIWKQNKSKEEIKYALRFWFNFKCYIIRIVLIFYVEKFTYFRSYSITVLSICSCYSGKYVKCRDCWW